MSVVTDNIYEALDLAITHDNPSLFMSVWYIFAKEYLKTKAKYGLELMTLRAVKNHLSHPKVFKWAFCMMERRAIARIILISEFDLEEFNTTTEGNLKYLHSDIEIYGTPEQRKFIMDNNLIDTNTYEDENVFFSEYTRDSAPDKKS